MITVAVWLLFWLCFALVRFASGCSGVLDVSLRAVEFVEHLGFFSGL